ncbi:EipB family protein [Fodinicurvata halophila]|uniref:EipB family protein n=1 Tax=Fodinicurvata halophila TaxID=1419723 RepID=UPI00360A3B71
MRITVWTILCGFVAMALGSPVGAATPFPKSAGDFQPHRATYDLTLEREQSTPDIAAATGRLQFEWADGCSGWTVNQSSRIFLERSEGPVVDFGWSISSWEAKRGDHYRFSIRHYADGRKTDERQGEAHLSAPGQQGTATFNTPEEREVKLPSGTVLPSWHSFELLDQARRGALPLWRMVFDGSGDNDGYAGVSVHKLRSYKGEEAFDEFEALRGEPSWRLHMAYFEPERGEMLPINEQTLRLYRNGIADELRFDYGDFTLEGHLAKLEELPDAGC